MIKRIDKKYFKILSLVLALILVLVVIYFVDLSKFNSRLVKYDEKYFLSVTYLIADRDELDEGITIDDTIYHNEDSILYTTSELVPMTKEGDYLYVDLGKFANKLVLEHDVDAAFANNNTNGEVLEDCFYDKETNIVKVPFSHYANEKGSSATVQVEIESLLTKKEIKNIKTNYSVKKLVTYENTTSNELLEMNTKIPLSNYVNGNISKDNLYIYLNRSDVKLDKEAFEYDYKTETLVIDMPAILINQVDIKLGNNIIKNVFAATNPKTPSQMNGFKLTEEPTAFLSKKSYITSGYKRSSDGLKYCYVYKYIESKQICVSSGGYGSTANKKITVFKFNRSYEKLSSGKYTDANHSTLAVWPYILKTSAAGKANNGTVYLPFAENNIYIIMLCTHNSVKQVDLDNNLYVKISIAENHASENYLILKASTVNSSGDNAAWAGQHGIAYFKVYWEDTGCKLNATKTVNTFNNDSGTATSTVSVYENDTCTGTPVTSKNISVNLTNGASGTAQITNLTINKTYYIKETAFTVGSTNLLTSRYGYDSGCIPITTVDDDGDKICDSSVSVSNTQRKYCYSIKKVDAEDGDIVVNNTTWKLVGADGDTHNATATNGIAVFTDLKYQNYTLTETTVNPADLDGNGTLDYWNDNSTGVTIAASRLTEGDTCNNPTKMIDTKVYYCIKVKKTDFVTGEILDGAEFTATKGNITIDKNSNDYGSNNGITSFFVGDSTGAGNWTITESKAPEGYIAETSSKVVAAIPLKEYDDREAARLACLSNLPIASDGTLLADKTYNTNNDYVFRDKQLIINWYKTTENGSTRVNGAEFKVKDSSGNYITVSSPSVQKDANNFEKACYVYTGTNNTGTVMTSGDAGNTGMNMTGQVCVSGLPTGTYTVIETKSPEYHTFGSSSTMNLTSSNTFTNMTNSNKFVNYPTEFRFTKQVTNTDGSQEGETKYTVTINGVTKNISLSEMTTEELKKIGFSVYNSNGNVVNVKYISEGYYEYTTNTIDQVGTGNNITVLHLDSNRQINIKHLPKGEYSIKEIDTSDCSLSNGGFGTVGNPSTRPSSAPTCAQGGSHSGDCIGYYSPDYSSNTYRFTIDDCSSSTAAQNTTSCSANAGIEIQTLTNNPTEVILTKKDLYSYSDQADIIDNDRIQNSTETAVEFENAKERSDFDRIDFKVKDSSGRYLNFVYVGNSSNTCTSDSDYNIYKYIPGLALPVGVDPDVFNYHSDGNGLTITQTLHACGGHIKLINLCRGETYTFEEIRVPDDSVYVLEKQGELNPTACFEVPCTNNEQEQRTSKTAVINDKPTRVTFEKKDGKYNYLIPDETTTFEVYRCPKVDGNNTLCSPGSYNSVEEREQAGMKLIKFEPRSTISNDEEDPGLEVYRMMSDSDAEGKSLCTNNQTTNCYVTGVHPDAGRLVLRYLQSGYNYVLLETVAPKNYMLPAGKGAETPFTVVNTTVDVEEVNVPNSPTALLIRKYADIDGDNQADSTKLLGGAKFRVYKVTNYNANLKARDQEKELIKLKTIKDGIYENRPVLDTDVITTCSGDNCSYSPSSLGYDGSVWQNLDELISKSGTDVTSILKEGTALIQYLEYDTYYVIEEVEAPVGYSLPENDDNRFTLVHIRKNETEVVDTRDALVNKPTSFTFYKFDEYNTPLDGASFYLQKLDQEKKYNTLTVSKETLEDGSIIYKADENSELKEITTTGGKATVYYLEPGQYRILEIKAAEGYELPKKTINVATFFVDDDGVVYGSNIITNKKPSDTVKYLADAKSELIINIQTGKVVIKYGLIITVIIGAIVGLLIFLNKRK